MNRGKIGIIANILKVAEKDALKSHITSKCRLTSEKTKEYIQLLLTKGLLNAFPLGHVRHVPGRPNRHRMTYQTTEIGKQFLKKFAEISALVEEWAASSFREKFPFSPLSKKVFAAPSTIKRVS